ncbi:MAG: L-seryl-tRNA(Sec) selenium transferase [Deltaproteobacteria bacterium]|nr:L-seryl-tRNA(Sec) selenium transferase [Deltaproteobacteria bacterium]
MATRKWTDQVKHELMSRLPKVDAVAGDAALDGARRRLGPMALTNLVREAVRQEREQVLATGQAPSRERVVEGVLAAVEATLGARARRVINAAGVVLHTNLGRAPLSTAAVAALTESAGGYTSIELDLSTGRRGARGAFAEHALSLLTGAEDALVVNNNAAAVLLALTALVQGKAAVAKGKGVVVSRGELVEIGGSFRVPDVLARSGARMIEVGTTNRTRIDDYRRALDEDPDVAVLLRVHQGNFRQIGFVERPTLSELSALAKERGVTFVKDLGGGALVDLTEAGLGGEPVVRDCVEAGAQLVCFSCDKVLGGPQGGVVVGEAELVNRLRRDPLARALRLGRLPLVALEATLASYLEGDLEAIPAMAAMRRPVAAVRERVEAWRKQLDGRGIRSQVIELDAAVGGGALAEAPLASVALVVETDEPSALARRLRTGTPPVLVRIQDDQVLIDGRSVLPGEDEELLAAVVTAAQA